MSALLCVWGNGHGILSSQIPFCRFPFQYATLVTSTKTSAIPTTTSTITTATSLPPLPTATAATSVTANTDAADARMPGLLVLSWIIVLVIVPARLGTARFVWRYLLTFSPSNNHLHSTTLLLSPLCGVESSRAKHKQ